MKPFLQLMPVAVAASIAVAQPPAPFVQGLQLPYKMILTPARNLLVSEGGTGANQGRISLVTQAGASQSILDGLPAGVNNDSQLLVGLSFSYDGFGNRLSQTITQGTAQPWTASYDMATNHISTAGYGYDANGNMTSMGGQTFSYDVENRLSNGGTYGYGLDNRRVVNGSSYYLYGPDGQKLGTYQVTGGQNVFF